MINYCIWVPPLFGTALRTTEPSHWPPQIQDGYYVDNAMADSDKTACWLYGIILSARVGNVSGITNPPQKNWGMLGSSKDYFRGFLKSLHAKCVSQDFRLIDFKWDWRLGLGRAASQLSAAIAALPDRGRVVLLGHSAGGLIARLAGSQSNGAVDRIVSLGSPHYGSWDAAALLSGVHRHVDDAVFWSGMLHYWAYLRPQDELPGISRETVSRCIGSWQSIYDLLPRPAAHITNDPHRQSATVPSIYSNSAELQAARFAQAQQFHASYMAIDNYKPPSGHWAMIGGGISTMGKLITPPITHSSDFPPSTRGDGLVLMETARLPQGTDIEFQFRVAHTYLPEAFLNHPLADEFLLNFAAPSPPQVNELRPSDPGFTGEAPATPLPLGSLGKSIPALKRATKRMATKRRKTLKRR